MLFVLKNTPKVYLAENKKRSAMHFDFLLTLLKWVKLVFADEGTNHVVYVPDLTDYTEAKKEFNKSYLPATTHAELVNTEPAQEETYNEK